MSHAVDNSELLTTMSRSPHSQVVFVLHVQAVHNIDTPMFQDVDCSVCVWDTFWTLTFLETHQTSIPLNTHEFIWKIIIVFSNCFILVRLVMDPEPILGTLGMSWGHTRHHRVSWRHTFTRSFTPQGGQFSNSQSTYCTSIRRREEIGQPGKDPIHTCLGSNPSSGLNQGTWSREVVMLPGEQYRKLKRNKSVQHTCGFYKIGTVITARRSVTLKYDEGNGTIFCLRLVCVWLTSVLLPSRRL